MYIHKKCNQKNDSRNQKNIVSESKNSTLQEGKKELINNRRVEGGSALQKQKREETKSHGSFNYMCNDQKTPWKASITIRHHYSKHVIYCV
jgi:hypothetical protein